MDTAKTSEPRAEYGIVWKGIRHRGRYGTYADNFHHTTYLVPSYSATKSQLVIIFSERRPDTVQ